MSGKFGLASNQRCPEAIERKGHFAHWWNDDDGDWFCSGYLPTTLPGMTEENENE